jgi:hypothetical protein
MIQAVEVLLTMATLENFTELVSIQDWLNMDGKGLSELDDQEDSSDASLLVRLWE